MALALGHLHCTLLVKEVRSQQANIRAKQERQQQELAEQLLQRYRERFGELPD
ncbi:hypothetical protein [Nostoc sp.]|uniref:hypothetical protein n=1 Tax=Nostoc sp. TaxID=1180 RepID=UPI002FEFC9ED